MRLEYWSSRKKSHWFSSHFWSSFCCPWLSPSLAACHTFLTRSHSRVNTSLVTQRLSPLLYFLFTAANKKIRCLSKLRNSKQHSGHWSGCGHVASCGKTLSFADIFWLNVPDFSLWTLTLCWSSAIWLSFKFVTAVHLYWCCRTCCITSITSSITMNGHPGEGQKCVA